MSKFDRRDFIIGGTLGLATSWLSSLALPASAAPTERSGELGAYGDVLAIEPPRLADDLRPTEKNAAGPFYREGAPFRAKVTPCMEPGEPLVVRGRVWGFDTKKPLADAILDVWQANSKGFYDNSFRGKPPKKGVFKYRARMRTDETGYYEFETIKPGGYSFRTPHIHYIVSRRGYQTVVTQLFFKGEPMNSKDPLVKPSLIVDPIAVTTEYGRYLLGTFDIVLLKAL